MLVDSLLDITKFRNEAPAAAPYTLPETVALLNTTTTSGETVTAETSKNIATAYRCGNVLSDDVAKMPFQIFTRRDPRKIERILPDGRIRNLAWNLEVQPNRYMNPFIWKKTVMLWLVYWGNAYIWQPPNQRELYILPASLTFPKFSREDGSRWFQTIFPNGKLDYLPDTEVLHLMINSIDGYQGQSVISYARETIGRQLGAHKTQGKFYAQGLNASGIMWSNGDLSPAAREKARDEFERVMAGSDNAYRLVVADQKWTKFENISMKANDMQFLEGIQATDQDIANFFGLPLYKLNQGKQSYQSNEQQNLDYLNTTLDPYLVQWEQAAALSWLSTGEQGITYFRFNRDVILRTDAKSRAEVLVKKIQSGLLSPNEGRQIEDQSSYPDGDSYYMPSNIQKIGGKQNAKPEQPGSQN